MRDLQTLDPQWARVCAPRTERLRVVALQFEPFAQDVDDEDDDAEGGITVRRGRKAVQRGKA